MNKINSHNERDKLKEVIVGSATGTSATIEWYSPKKIDPRAYEEALSSRKLATPKKVLEKTSEDPDSLSKVLENYRAKVLRPNVSGMSPPWVGINFLSLDKETIVVDERQKSLIKFLKEKKFKVITVKMRHMYTQGGAYNVLL